MERNYHLFNDGELKRDENTLRFEPYDGETSYIPISDVEALFAHGQITYNTRLLSFLDENGVALHVFGWNDTYSGTFLPSKQHESGSTLVKQVNAYESTQKRREIAAEQVKAAIHNMNKNVEYYQENHELSDVSAALRSAEEKVTAAKPIDELLGAEAEARKAYYSLFDTVTPENMNLGVRETQPPTNEMNAVLSYANMLLYSTATSAIQATALEPTVSYLHEPGDRRQSLALDIADVFKPIITDRIILRLVNRRQLRPEHFRNDLNQCLLNEEGRKIITKEFEDQLEETVEHPRLERHVSYQYLLRLEVYSLKKHILTGEEYTSTRRWW